MKFLPSLVSASPLLHLKQLYPLCTLRLGYSCLASMVYSCDFSVGLQLRFLCCVWDLGERTLWSLCLKLKIRVDISRCGSSFPTFGVGPLQGLQLPLVRTYFIHLMESPCGGARVRGGPMLLAIPPGFSVNPLSCKMPCAMLQGACVPTQQHQPSGLRLCPSHQVYVCQS